jgi:hypothetical protein
MLPPISQVHISHLISELRMSASENIENSLADDDASWELGLIPGLMNDAADAIEALASERIANGPRRLALGLVLTPNELDS